MLVIIVELCKVKTIPLERHTKHIYLNTRPIIKNEIVYNIVRKLIITLH